MKIIALCGFKQSGKSTAFEIIKDQNSNKVVKEAAFANRLKEVCSLVFKIPRNHFDDQDIKEVPFVEPLIMTKEHAMQILELYNMDSKVDGAVLAKFIRDFKERELKTPRGIAQYIGTEFLRTLRSDIHCETLKDIMVAQANEVDIFVVTDCRFLNEIVFFKDEETFEPFFIHRLDAYDSFLVELEAGKSHPSEIETLSLIPKCKILNNNKNKEDFANEIKNKVKA